MIIPPRFPDTFSLKIECIQNAKSFSSIISFRPAATGPSDPWLNIDVVVNGPIVTTS